MWRWSAAWATSGRCKWWERGNEIFNWVLRKLRGESNLKFSLPPWRFWCEGLWPPWFGPPSGIPPTPGACAAFIIFLYFERRFWNQIFTYKSRDRWIKNIKFIFLCQSFERNRENISNKKPPANKFHYGRKIVTRPSRYQQRPFVGKYIARTALYRLWK